MLTRPRLDHLFTAKSPRFNLYFWLGLSLIVSVGYSFPALQAAFGSEYVVQDDARQHVFWMRRFLDPGLFPNDVMADYFQAVAPWGYASLYHLFAWVHVDPIVLSKILPMVLGLITTAYCFGVATQILPVPAAGFTAAVFLNQNLWMRDDLSSATPGAFFYPIFLAFLYYLLRRSLWPCLTTIVLQGLFYPQCVFLSAGILLIRLLEWQGGVHFSINRAQIRFSAIGLGVAFLVMLLYAFKSSGFGPAIGLAEAKTLPAFSPTGWSAFFSDHFVDFWLCGKRSGMIPTEWCDLAKDSQEVPRLWLALLRFPAFWLGLLFPVVLKANRHFPLTQRLTADWRVLPQGLLVSIGMFFVAHALAFKLHLPNRYTEHTFRILLALTAGITLVILLHNFFAWLFRSSRLQSQQLIVTGFSALLIAVFVFYPYSLEIDHQPFPVTGYVTGKHPALYQFFAKQPKDIVIASLTEEANQLPTFAERSLFVGGEGYVLPYHPKYFQQVSQRLLQLVQAQYSPDLSQTQDFIRQHKIDFWLLDRESFQPDFADPKSYLNSLFQQFPETQPIQSQLQSGTVPALAQAVDACSAFKKQGLVVLRAKCVLKQ